MKTVFNFTTLLLLFAISLHAESNHQGFQRGTSWDDFVYPKVTVVDKDGGTSKGSQLVHRLIPDLESYIQEIAKGVCQKLYKEVNEVPNFDELIFELEYRDGVAYKGGNPPRITINLSTKYLEEQYNQNGDEAILYEIAGVNWHELTHAYQHVPQNAGGYNGGTEFFGFIEGTADAVRILAGYHNTRSPYPGGNWRDGYTTSGFFIEWVQKSYDKDFLYKLNRSCLTINPWSYEKAFQEIFGQSVQSLWDQYQWYLQNGGNEAVAQFSISKNLICKGETVEFTNSSFNNPDSYYWEFTGGDITGSSDINPVVTYEIPGTYSVSLTATNSDGSTTKELKNGIIVADVEGTMIELTQPNGSISTDADQPFHGEDVEQLLDGDSNTKMCVKTGSLRIEYDSDTSSLLYAYSFTSAGDATWRDPENWTLTGSNDGTNWDNLDQQSNVVFANRKETQLFTVDSREKYRFYRFDISARTDTMFQLADITLFGVELSEPVATSAGSVNKTKFSMHLRGSTLHLSKDFTYRELEIYNLRGVQLESLRGGNISGNAVSLDHLASGCYIMRVKVKNMNNEDHSFSSSFILK